MRFNWKKYIPWFIILCLTILLVCKKEQIQTVTIQVKTKKPRYDVFLGTFTTIPTKDITAPVLGANISLKTPKTIYSLGFDTQQNLMLGASFKLF